MSITYRWQYFSNGRTTAESLAKVNEVAKQKGWTHFFQGTPTDEKLKEYAEEIAKVMPNIKFLPIDLGYATVAIHDDKGVYQTTENIRVCDSYALYMNDYPFTLGLIKHGDNSVRRNSDKPAQTYAIYSRKITNAKYGNYRDQHNMITASDLKKAIKNVLKYVVPFTPKELAMQFYDPMQSSTQRAIEKARHALNEAASPVKQNQHAILAEIRNLKAQGVKFITKEFQTVADNSEEVLDKYEEEYKRKVNAFFARCYAVGENTYVDLQEAIDIRGNNSFKAFTDGEYKTYNLSELPQDIAGSISVLSILTNDQYVERVGMKLDDNHFWIERG